MKRNFLIIIVIWLVGCQNKEQKCNAPTSAVWSVVTENSNYYEMYWDSQGNNFIFDGILGEAFMALAENDSLVNQFITSVEQDPCREKELTFSFFRDYVGVKKSAKMYLEGRYVYFIDSTQLVNYNLFKDEAYKRYLKWSNPQREVETKKDTLIEIIDTLAAMPQRYN